MMMDGAISGWCGQPLDVQGCFWSNPSVSKSHQVYVVIFRFFFVN
jgi:hypothetical protein